MGDNPLITKQPIIVLREELEYFAIPPPSARGAANARPGAGASAGSAEPHSTGVAARLVDAVHPLAHAQTTQAGQPTPALTRLKREAGRALLERRKVFTALQRNVSKEGNLAEQHLIDMLCMRCVECGAELPRRRDPADDLTALTRSQRLLPRRHVGLPRDRADAVLHLVDRARPAQDGHHARRRRRKGRRDRRRQRRPAADGDGAKAAALLAETGGASCLLCRLTNPCADVPLAHAVQRKCWWDGVEVDIPVEDGSKETARIKVWARRVWTLELSLI